MINIIKSEYEIKLFLCKRCNKKVVCYCVTLYDETKDQMFEKTLYICADCLTTEKLRLQHDGYTERKN